MIKFYCKDIFTPSTTIYFLSNDHGCFPCLKTRRCSSIIQQKNSPQISMTKKTQQIVGRPSNSQEQQVVKKIPVTQAKKKARSGRPTKKKDKQIKNCQQSSLMLSQDQQSSQNFIIEAGIQIIHRYIDFFSQIDEKNGFVFKPRQRQQLSKCINHIKFTLESQWIKEQEFDKISKACQTYKCDSQSLKNLMLESSTIFAKQFTGEHYFIILKVYTILIEGFSADKQMNLLNNLARKINENQNYQFLFFSLVYKSRIKTRYSRPELMPYQKLIKEIANILRKYIIQYQNKESLNLDQR